MGSQRFPRAARLVKKPQFDAVFASGLRQHSDYFRVHLLPGTGTSARLGLAIAKRIAPRAVDRNRLKRAAREAFRRRTQPLAGMDLVLHAKDAAVPATTAALHADLARLFERLSTRVPPQVPGSTSKP